MAEELKDYDPGIVDPDEYVASRTSRTRSLPYTSNGHCSKEASRRSRAARQRARDEGFSRPKRHGGFLITDLIK